MSAAAPGWLTYSAPYSRRPGNRSRLLRDLVESTGSPTLAEIRQAAMAVFAARVDEAAQLGLATRAWPPTLVAYPHWTDDFARAAVSGGLDVSLDMAVCEVNAWIEEIDLVGLPEDEAPRALGHGPDGGLSEITPRFAGDDDAPKP